MIGLNEALFSLSIVLFFWAVLMAQVLFGKLGLYAWVVIALVLANIGVIKVVTLFGFEMTLGNVLFCTTFFATDLLSERWGKQAAYTAVPLGFMAGAAMVLVSQIWLAYIPSKNDFASPALDTVFAMTPRIVISSLVVFLICEYLDIYLYHRIWNWTTRLFKSERRGLWIRNNGTRFVSQAVNNVLFTLLAFYGVWPLETFISILGVSLGINFFIALLDTPFAYLGRRLGSGILLQRIDA
jgi:uncharacterized integral membrane protein (TIGR00697 family)